MSSTPKDQYLAVCEEIAFQRKRAEKAEAELREVTQTCADPRVNLTATLAECVRDAFAEIERLRADLAAAQMDAAKTGEREAVYLSRIQHLMSELAAARTRPDSEAADAIKEVREFLRRVTHWQEGKPDCHDAMEALDKADDDIDWIEHGIIEWRDVALKAQSGLAAARAELAAEEQRVADMMADVNRVGHANDALRQDLAAARALLLEARMRIWHTCGSEGESKCLSHRIDAALAEGKK